MFIRGIVFFMQMPCQFNRLPYFIHFIQFSLTMSVHLSSTKQDSISHNHIAGVGASILLLFKVITLFARRILIFLTSRATLTPCNLCSSPSAGPEDEYRDKVASTQGTSGSTIRLNNARARLFGSPAGGVFSYRLTNLFAKTAALWT